MSIQLSSSQISPFQKSNLLTQCSNKIATIGNTSLKIIEPFLVSTTLGIIVGKLTDASKAKCALQCLLSRFIFNWISKPIMKFIQENSGLDEHGTSNKKGQNFLFITIKIIEVALSIFIVNKFGNQILEKIKLFLPTHFSNHLKTSDKALRSTYSKSICFAASLVGQFSCQNFRLMNIFKVFFDNSKALNLPNGKMISINSFCKHSLFAHAPENKKVFFQLLTYINSNFFHRDYQIFLDDIKTENWFQNYEDTPYTLAYLSLIAFFSNAIDQEELFIANLVAYGFKEKNSKSITLKIGTLNRENATSLLIDRNFPIFTKNFYDFQVEINPSFDEAVENILGKDKDNFIFDIIEGNFSKLSKIDDRYTKDGIIHFVDFDDMESVFLNFKENNKPPFLTNLKTYSELKIERDKFLNTLPFLSPIKRTFLNYSLKTINEDSKNITESNEYTKEKCFYFENKICAGIKTNLDNSTEIMLLLPRFVIEFSRSATKNICHVTDDHCYKFGFSENKSYLFKGIRSISIPSPLFAIPHPDDLTVGSAGFQMYYRDLYYHISIDSNNPHINIICRLATLIQSIAIKEKHIFTKKTLLLFASKLADRKVLYYQSGNQNEIFLNYINRSFYDAFCEIQEKFYYSDNEIVNSEDRSNSTSPFPDSFTNWLWNTLTVEEKKYLKIDNEDILKDFIKY